MGLLLLAEEGDTAAMLVDKLQSAASVRVKPRSGMRVVYKGRPLEPQTTVTSAGIQPLDRVDVVLDSGSA